MNEHTNLLEIKDLTVHYVTVDGTVHAVENLNLTLPEGKTLGLVGETGAGKTTTVKAIMQILPDPPAKILTGEVIFCGEDLLKKNKKCTLIGFCAEEGKRPGKWRTAWNSY